MSKQPERPKKPMTANVVTGVLTAEETKANFEAVVECPVTETKPAEVPEERPEEKKD